MLGLSRALLRARGVATVTLRPQWTNLSCLKLTTQNATGSVRWLSTNMKKAKFSGNTRRNPVLEKKLFLERKKASVGGLSKMKDIPVKVAGADLTPVEAFDSDSVHPLVLKNLRACGLEMPTPIQSYCMALTQTGSGKTVAFLIPTLSNMLRDGCLRPEESDYSLAQFPNTLILVPTRELALQVEAEAQKAVFGGEKPMIQLRKLSTGCDVLVATPGRLIDFLSQGVVSVAAVKNLILDEADRMLDIGFEPQLRQIVEASGMPKDRRTTLFSATFPPSVQNLARDFLSKDFASIFVGQIGAPTKDVKQEIIPVEDKFGMLVQVLRGEERFSELPEAAKTGNCIVFVETKSMADVIEGQLSRIGIRAAAMHGDKSQQQRFRALNAFKKGNTRVLIATDVAARGLDIDDIGLVINYDVPSNIDSYVHRIGRTGRAGREGYAISFVNGRDSGLLPDLKKLFEDNDQPLSEEFHDLMRQCIRSRPRNRNSFRRGHRASSLHVPATSHRDNHFFRGGSGPRRGRSPSPRHSSDGSDREFRRSHSNDSRFPRKPRSGFRGDSSGERDSGFTSRSRSDRREPAKDHSDMLWGAPRRRRSDSASFKAKRKASQWE